MVRLFVRHNVTDYAVWRSAYEAFDAERKSMGVTGAAVFRSIDDPNNVTAWHDFTTAEEAKRFGASPRLRDVMEKAGVASAPEIWYVTEA